MDGPTGVSAAAGQLVKNGLPAYLPNNDIGIHTLHHLVDDACLSAAPFQCTNAG